MRNQNQLSFYQKRELYYQSSKDIHHMNISLSTCSISVYFSKLLGNDAFNFQFGHVKGREKIAREFIDDVLKQLFFYRGSIYYIAMEHPIVRKRFAASPT